MASFKQHVKKLKARWDKKIGRHERVRLDKGEVAQGLWLRMWLCVHRYRAIEFIFELFFYVLIGWGF